MEKFKLKRTVQCAKCPWKVSTNPFDIPDGYSEEQHKNLEGTISDGSIKLGGVQRVMACHHSKEGQEEYCIGWLNNQLGIGNNIQMRIKMVYCENRDEIKVVGKQHKHFKETLPENKNNK